MIRSTVEGSVTRITISRAERKNAFDAELIRAVTAAAREVERTTRVVVLQSEGDTFCAGADLEWMRGMAGFTLEENRADSRALAEMYRSLYELEMPLVARVQGAAIGTVHETDFGQRIAFTETRLGILPAVVSPYVVRKVGPARATALFVTGSRIDAKRAHEIGLVERLVEPADLDAAVGRVIEAILAAGPEAVRAAKRLVREVDGREPRDVLDLTIERIAKVRVSEEGQEGMRAFLERREPRW